MDSSRPESVRKPAPAELVSSLFDFEALPGRYALTLREPRALFDRSQDVLLLASGRPVEGLSLGSADAANAQRAASFFVRTAMLRPGADHYTLLGLEPGFDKATLRDHYRMLIRLTHPDFVANSGAWPADAATRINQANDVMGSPVQRAEYDQLLSTGFNRRSTVNRLAHAPEDVRPVSWGWAAAAVGSVGALALVLVQWQGGRVEDFHSPQMAQVASDAPASGSVPVGEASPAARRSGLQLAVTLAPPSPSSEKRADLPAKDLKRPAAVSPAVPVLKESPEQIARAARAAREAEAAKAAKAAQAAQAAQEAQAAQNAQKAQAAILARQAKEAQAARLAQAAQEAQAARAAQQAQAAEGARLAREAKEAQAASVAQAAKAAQEAQAAKVAQAAREAQAALVAQAAQAAQAARSAQAARATQEAAIARAANAARLAQEAKEAKSLKQAQAFRDAQAARDAQDARTAAIARLAQTAKDKQAARLAPAAKAAPLAQVTQVLPVALVKPPLAPIAAAPQPPEPVAKLGLPDAQPMLNQLIQAMPAGRGEDLLRGLEPSIRRSSGAADLVNAYNFLVGGSRAVKLGPVQLRARPGADQLVVDGLVQLVLQDQGQPMPVRELRLRATFVQREGRAVLTELSAGGESH